jgi:hypothetical protein
MPKQQALPSVSTHGLVFPVTKPPKLAEFSDLHEMSQVAYVFKRGVASRGREPNGPGMDATTSRALPQNFN